MSYSAYQRSSQIIKSTDKKVVKRAMAYVLRKFHALGLKLPIHRLRLSFVDKAQLCGIAKVSIDADILGLTVSDSSQWGYYHHIYILDNLPIFLHLETVAHEMGHVWLQENARKLNSKSPQEIEGFCELVAYKTLQYDPSMAALNQRNLMLQNPDPIYGAGLRLMKSRADAIGWNAFLSQMRTGEVSGEFLD